MSFNLRKPRLSSGAIAAAVGVAFVIGSAGGAYAGHKIQTKDIAKHAVTWNKIDKKTQKKINKAGQKGAAGAAGADGRDGVALAGSVIPASPVTIDHIGDGFADHATSVPNGTMHLDAGTYLINGDAYFQLNDAGQADADAGTVHTHLELAIRGPVSQDNTWGDDFGGCITGPYAVPRIESTCSTSRLITLSEPTDISVKLFGYNEEQGNVGSGDYDATINVSAVKVAVPAS